LFARARLPSRRLQRNHQAGGELEQIQFLCGHVFVHMTEELAPLALRNQRLFYNLLFRAVSETLLEIAADPRRLGARIGVLAVLHTWSQNLRHHPHLHGYVAKFRIRTDRVKSPCRSQ
jgi:hypothetical protein